MMWLRLNLLACMFFLAILPAHAAVSQPLKPFMRGSAQEITAVRAGKPYILAFWSVSCVHCRAELDMLAKLGKQYPGLEVVLVATDPIEEREAVSAVLRQYSWAQAEKWVFADDFVERLHFEVDRQWRGELPRTYLYGPGNAVTAISGKPDVKKLERWIKEVRSSGLARNE